MLIRVQRTRQYEQYDSDHQVNQYDISIYLTHRQRPTMGDQPTECPICMDDTDGAYTTLPCCRNVLHAECYVKCIAVDPRCPLCRHDAAATVSHTTVTVHGNEHTDNAARCRACILTPLLVFTAFATGFISPLVIILIITSNPRCSGNPVTTHC